MSVDAGQRAARGPHRGRARASGSTRSGRSLIEGGELERLDRGGLAARRHLEPGDLREGDPRLDRLRRRSSRELAAGGQVGRARSTSEIAIQDIQIACRRAAPGLRRDGRRTTATSRSRSTPDLAHDTERRSRRRASTGSRVDRPNLMIKIPGTDEGVPAIEEAIYEGININVTLLFSVEAYETVAEAYIRGLERRQEAGESLDVHSVASFFVSRVDTEVDKRLEELGRERPARAAGGRQRARRLPALQGDLPRRALRRAARGRRAGPAAAVGVDRRQEPAVPRDDVRRRAGRRPTPSTRCRCRRCSPPPSSARSRARRPTRTRRADLRALAERRHRHGRRDRQAAARRRSTRSWSRSTS